MARKEVVVDEGLVGYCGLYCAACRAYRRGRCPGCHDNEKATWCKVRTCCIDRGYASCAECTEFPDTKACKLFNSIPARIFGFIFRSDRAACIRQIKELGLGGHAEAMARLGRHSMKP